MKIVTMICGLCVLFFACGCIEFGKSNAYIEIRDANTHKTFTKGEVWYRTYDIGFYKTHKTKAVDGLFPIKLYNGWAVSSLESPDLDISMVLVSFSFPPTDTWEIINDRNRLESEYLKTHTLEMRCIDKKP